MRTFLSASFYHCDMRSSIALSHQRVTYDDFQKDISHFIKRFLGNNSIASDILCDMINGKQAVLLNH